jgi:hypothetical protein
MKPILFVFLILFSFGCGQNDPSGNQVSEAEADVDQLIIDTDPMKQPVVASVVGSLIQLKSKSRMSNEKLLSVLNRKVEVLCDQDGCRFQKKGN